MAFSDYSAYVNTFMALQAGDVVTKTHLIDYAGEAIQYLLDNHDHSGGDGDGAVLSSLNYADYIIDATPVNLSTSYQSLHSFTLGTGTVVAQTAYEIETSIQIINNDPGRTVTLALQIGDGTTFTDVAVGFNTTLNGGYAANVIFKGTLLLLTTGTQLWFGMVDYMQIAAAADTTGAAVARLMSHKNTSVDNTSTPVEFRVAALVTTTPTTTVVGQVRRFGALGSIAES